jgi:hypothetical protein
VKCLCAWHFTGGAVCLVWCAAQSYSLWWSGNYGQELTSRGCCGRKEGGSTDNKRRKTWFVWENSTSQMKSNKTFSEASEVDTCNNGFCRSVGWGNKRKT